LAITTAEKPGGRTLEVGVGRAGVAGGSKENPPLQPAPMRGRIAAIVAKVVDALEGEMSGHEA